MTKRRVKSDKPLIPIDSWEQADELVRQIGNLQIKINAANYRQTATINQVKAATAQLVKSKQQDIDHIARSLEAFAMAHKDDFGKAQSRKLNFGTLGWRKSIRISIKKTTLDLIKKVFSKRGAAVLIRVKEEVDKEALAKITDETLAEVGARRIRTETFFVEPFFTGSSEL